MTRFAFIFEDKSSSGATGRTRDQADVLFRIFAETEATPAGIASFARQFGSPWAKIERVNVAPEGRLLLFVKNVSKIKLPTDWPKPLLDLRRCVQLWDLINTPGSGDESRQFRWKTDPDGQLYANYGSYSDRKPGGAVPSSETKEELIERLLAGETSGSSLLHIEQKINVYIKGLVVPRMQGTSLLLVPRNLLTALWLQFAQSIAEGRVYGQCKVCQAWFETAIPGTRKSRVYCSDSCKLKAHLERKLEVLRRYENGQTVKEIARGMGITKDTVKLWLSCEK